MFKAFSLRIQNAVVDFLLCRYDSVPCVEDSVCHMHFNYELHFAVSGQYTYHILNDKVEMGENQMLIIPPNTRHNAVSAAESVYDFRVLTLKIKGDDNGGFYRYLTSLLDENCLKPIGISKRLIGDVLSFWNGFYQEGYRNCIYMQSMTAGILYQICTLFGAEDAQRVEYAPHTEVQIENMVNNPHYSLSDIAEAIHYSTRQTARIIKQIYGCSLAEVRLGNQNKATTERKLL